MHILACQLEGLGGNDHQERNADEISNDEDDFGELFGQQIHEEFQADLFIIAVQAPRNTLQISRNTMRSCDQGSGMNAIKREMICSSRTRNMATMTMPKRRLQTLLKAPTAVFSVLRNIELLLY